MGFEPTGSNCGLERSDMYAELFGQLAERQQLLLPFVSSYRSGGALHNVGRGRPSATVPCP